MFVESSEDDFTDKSLQPESSTNAIIKRYGNPERPDDVLVQEKILTFEQASNCLSLLGKDESSMRYAYIRLSACDMKLTDIRTLLNFRHVLFVDVSGNYLQTAAIQIITNMPFVIQLQAQRNFIDSCAIKPMCYLQVLSLARNQIRDTIGVIQPSLEYLDLNYNQIYQMIFPSEEAPCLKELEMRGNLLFELSGTFPISLERLYLAENKITRFVGDDIGKMENLQILHLRNNLIKKLNGFTSNLKNLKYLNLRQNKITKLRQFRKLQELPALEVLIILQNPVAANMETSRKRSEADGMDEEELGEEHETLDPNRIGLLALLPNLKRINKTMVTYLEREEVFINGENKISEIIEEESSDDDDFEPFSTTTDFITEGDVLESQILGEVDPEEQII